MLKKQEDQKKQKDQDPYMRKRIRYQIWSAAKYIIIPIFVVAVLATIFWVVDYLADGELLSFIESNYSHYEAYDDGYGNIYVSNDYRFEDLKTDLLLFFVVFVFIMTFIVLLITDIWKWIVIRKNSRRVGGYMDRFILQEETIPVDIPVGFGEVFAKISEVRTKEAQDEKRLLEETTKKDELVTYLAHDLRTPLTSVIGYLTLLRDEPDLSEETRKRYTEITVNKAERLEELVNELFEITRYNIRKIELEKGKINLSLMMEQILFDFKPILQEKNLRFETEITPNVEAVLDADKIERVIDNLLRNAIFYCYPDTAIHISLKKGEEILQKNADHSQMEMPIRIIVKNQGKNIPEEKLKRIFDRFYRADSSRNTRTGGFGLGLAIAKDFAEAHGGSIQAECEGETIRFSVTLPSGLQEA